MMKIAILGVTGHVGKNIQYLFARENTDQLYLFSRYRNAQNMQLLTYDKFHELDYDVIINCIGISDPAKIESEGNSILKLTGDIDSMILEYMQKNTNTKLINFSSGAVYGEEFDSPVKDSTLPKNLQEDNTVSSYAIAKIKSEMRHREQDKLNIIDLRLFSFFSRFMDLNSRFLISEIIRSIEENKTLVTNESDFFRDYIHPKDLFSIDLYSKKPIAKFELLDLLQDKYGLQYEIKPNSGFSSPTGFKKNYFSQSKKAEVLDYKPKYSSLDTISEELPYFLKNK